MAITAKSDRNLPVTVDVSALHVIARQIGATDKQYRAAYSRALQRTAVTLRRQMLSEMKTALAPRRSDTLRRRVLSFRVSRTAALPILRLWFGLNALRVSELKGRIRGRIRPRHTRRDKQTGRFIRARRQAENAGFDPAGNLLMPQTFEHGEVARSARDNRRTVVIRDPATRRFSEAKVDISEPMLGFIEGRAFNDALEIFMRHFTTDLKGRVKANIKR